MPDYEDTELREIIANDDLIRPINKCHRQYLACRAKAYARCKKERDFRGCLIAAYAECAEQLRNCIRPNV